MFVTLTPFPTRVLAATLNRGGDEDVAAALYAATMLAMSIAFFSTYVWSARHKLFAEWIDDRHVGYLIRRNVAGLFAYAAAVGIAFASGPASLAICGVVAIYYLLPGRAPVRS